MRSDTESRLGKSENRSFLDSSADCDNPALPEKSLARPKIEKTGRIRAACEDSENLEPLIALATSAGGLINDDLRQIACMAMTVFHIHLDSLDDQGPFS